MEYKKCLVELDEILNYLTDEDLRKIPYEIRKAINEKKDKRYNWHFDTAKGLNEQNINRKTIAMLSYLNMEYLLDEEQRLLMEEIHKNNEKKLEKEKSRKYNSENIFKNNMAKNEEVTLVEQKAEKWYQKIFSFIKSILKKNIM